MVFPYTMWRAGARRRVLREIYVSRFFVSHKNTVGACGDLAFVWVGKACAHVFQMYPFDVFCFVVRVVFDGEFPVERFKEEVMDDFVDAAVIAGKPIVDR